MNYLEKQDKTIPSSNYIILSRKLKEKATDNETNINTKVMRRRLKGLNRRKLRKMQILFKNLMTHEIINKIEKSITALTITYNYPESNSKKISSDEDISLSWHVIQLLLVNYTKYLSNPTKRKYSIAL